MPDTSQTTTPASLSANAVFAGGGVRGIAHVGALAVAEERGYRWLNIAGTSAGALVAALLAAGYSAAELYTIMSDLDYRRFADGNLEGPLHLAAARDLLFRMGLHPGVYLEEFVRELLAAKGVREFGDLRIAEQQTSANPFLRYRLTVIASDLSSGRMLRLPHDLATPPASAYGLDPDRLDVAWAVRMSASIPFFYTPVNLVHAGGGISRIVDGGLLSNFPLFLFDEQAERPTLGFTLVDEISEAAAHAREPTNNLIAFTGALLDTLLNAHDRLYLDDHARARTIAIPASGIGATQFDLSPAQITRLYENGREAARAFFAAQDAAPGASA